MNTSEDNKGALLVLNVLEVLCGFAATGARNLDLAAQVKTSPVAISRTLAVLIKKGWARKGENGFFYPAPRFTSLSFRVLADFDRLQARIDDAKRAMTGT